MFPSLEYIKQSRIKLGITQKKLAKLSGISTSMINQIETGRCKPSYETAKKIFEILNTMEGNSSIKAGDICSKKLIFAKNNDILYGILDKMRLNFVSQIPIFEGERIVGILTEDGLAKLMLEKEEKDLKNMVAEQAMEPTPPIVDAVTPAKALVSLVRFAKCVLVSEKGKVTGIVTTTDILKLVE